ncbi:glycoside hydrolase family 3 C-terminal domain-containing protein [Asticcacaulis sp. ZE23SCel15]|uniref:glycoside hydrolase family 3 protein n=1 Tax=Asticcacaulis sp. ZE23SCel15 TaxID=3059027 RepID=UPI00265EDB6A|nr:glycoside hydrolase family 3 protein [Asticcacaulis sp. ZE23SCel15]WKL57141.1 glycoside hydrolase family 3 C-terminal domain-containing protein [Asticcacaulis sp. ZE23SCel15]
MTPIRTLLLTSATLAALAMPVMAQAPAAYQNQTLSPQARAVDIVSRLTLEEKAAQIQNNAAAIPRLNLPAYEWWNEGLHGVARAGDATVFPQAVGLAATWDTPLMQRVADVIATEFRAKNLGFRTADGSTKRYQGLTVWSPNVNIFRDPRWGRGQETYGEDPYLTSRMGVAFIKGLQGPYPAHPKTAATVKHLAVHSGPEADRHFDDIHPSKRDEIDTYLPAFHAAITEARVEGIMCAYNAVNGVPACGYTPYMRDRVKTDWGFKGHIVSDCAAIADFYLPTSHAYVKTPEEAIAVAWKAGTDLNCDFAANKTFDPQTTVNAVKQGLLSEALLDQALIRLFEIRYRLGLLDQPYRGPFAGIKPTDYDTPEHRALALETAEKSLVLLKNDGLLPFKGDPRRIAVIGPNANSVEALVGNYNGTPSKPVTIYAGLKARYPNAEVTFVEGTGWVAPPLENVPDAAFCQDAACATPGLKLEDFSGPKPEGTPVATTTVTNAQFRWGWPDRVAREASVRWSGYIRPSESGGYRFRYTGDAGYRVYIDDKLIADVWDIAWPTSDTAVPLEMGKTYKIRIEAAQKGQRGDHRLQWSPPGANDTKAIAAAQNADLVVFAAGLTARLEGEEMKVLAPGFAGGDRTSLDLPEPQQKLIERLHATGKPVVLVLMNGSAMSVNWADKNLPAIIEAWYPGGEGGHAVAKLIAGDFSPAGRLPVTFYKSADQLPPFKDYNMDGRTYRYFKGEALYPFGHGLSYTNFSYGKLKLDRTKIKAGQPVRVSVEVTNAGKVDGDEVVQLYVSRTTADAPIRALKGFERVSLKAGETKTVSFMLDAKAMSIVNQVGERVLEAGAVDLWVGGGQPHPNVAGAKATITVSGTKALPAF